MYLDEEEIIKLIIEYRETEANEPFLKIKENYQKFTDGIFQRHKLKPEHFVYDDLKNYCDIILMISIRNFDLDKGYKFLTYYGQTLKYELYKEYQEQFYTIRFPKSNHGLIHSLNKIEYKLSQTHDDMFNFINGNSEEMRNLLKNYKLDRSTIWKAYLSRQTIRGWENFELKDKIYLEHLKTYKSDLKKREIIELIQRFYPKSKKMWLYFIEVYYNDLTYQDVANKYGVSRQAVCEKCQKILTNNTLRDMIVEIIS